MDLELKEFEQKINSITEQFMSLLDSDKTADGSTEEKFDSINNIAEKQICSGPTIFNEGSNNIETSPYIESTNSYNAVSSFKGEANGSIFRVGADTINFGGIGYKDGYLGSTDVPKHAIKFDSLEQNEINKKLEGLYNEKKNNDTDIINTKPSIAFSDSNIGKINSIGINGIYEGYEKNQTDSTLNNKEVYEMAGYNGGEKKENVFYSFATVPTERALVEARDWKETLFMDIPWDTKIDLWGGIKKLCTAQVVITF